MMKKLLVVWGVCLLALSAQAEPKESKPSHFGAAFNLESEMTFEALMADPAKHAGKTIRVKGKVSSVCKKKGCWMVLGDPEKKEEFVRVRMKDYGFFLPLDCDGQLAVVEGVFTRKLLGEKMAKHYAEDAGKDPKNVKGERHELSMLANGIQLGR